MAAPVGTRYALAFSPGHQHLEAIFRAMLPARRPLAAPAWPPPPHASAAYPEDEMPVDAPATGHDRQARRASPAEPVVAVTRDLPPA